MSSATKPNSPEEIAEAIRQAVGEKSVSLSQNNPPNDSTTHLRLDHLNSIIDYPFDDMTITVQAGMTCKELAAILAEHNQQLPIDVSDPHTTIGQLVAGNHFGPRIAGYGTVRDYLIGIQGVDGTGRIFRSGGRVVKNVAGYDLCRLMIGSRGRLAVLTECTFKLKPQPEHAAAVRLQFDSNQQLSSALKALNETQTRPIVVDIHANPSTNHHAMLTVAVEGSTASCDWQLDQIESQCQAATVFRLTEMEIRDYPKDSENFRHNDDLQIKTLRSKVAAIADQLLHLKTGVSGYAADGILNCRDAPEIRDHLKTRFTTEQLILVDASPPFSAEQHPMNSPILNAFDPHSVFANPQSVASR